MEFFVLVTSDIGLGEKVHICHYIRNTIELVTVHKYMLIYSMLVQPTIGAFVMILF